MVEQKEKTVASAFDNLDDVYELTHNQMNNLQDYSEEPDTGLFHENLIFEFVGDIDVQIFRKAWEEVLQRHTILRTGFFYKGMSHPVQAVFKNVPLPLEVLDWRNFHPQECEAKIQEMLALDQIEPYILERAPLMRMSLILCQNGRYLFSWRFHHIIMDGWAFVIVLSDFLEIYKRHLGLSSSLTPGYAYKEYVSFRKQRDTGAEEAFWKQYLKDAPHIKPFERLESDFSSPIKTRQSRIDISLRDLFEPLTEAIKKKTLNLNSVFQGLFSLLMYRQTNGARDVVTGQIVADRPLSLKHAQAGVGLFVNTLPIRCVIEEKLDFTGWVKELQANMLQVFQYASSSEREIRTWTQAAHGESLFHGVLVFKNIPLSDDPFDGLPFRLNSTSLESHPNYPFMLFIWPDETLELKFIYDNKKYQEHEIVRFFDNLKAMILYWLDHSDATLFDMLGQTIV